MIDRIEHNVNQSEDFVKIASKDTKKAVKFQSAARKVSDFRLSIDCMSFSRVLALLALRSHSFLV